MAKTRNSTKGPAKKEQILETAFALFQKNGFEQTTMRDIAAECDMALGNTYYYFRSKEHMVYALYEKTLELQKQSSASEIANHQTFKTRMSAALNACITVLEPYHVVLRALFKIVADPDSELNPFGSDSKQLREDAIQMFSAVPDGSKDRIPDKIKHDLPRLLWLAHMGIIFYWLHDKSESHTKTRKLIAVTSDLLAALVTAASLPLMDRLWKLLMDLVNELDMFS